MERRGRVRCCLARPREGHDSVVGMTGGGFVAVVIASACLALASCGKDDQREPRAAAAPAPLTHASSGSANVLVLLDLSTQMRGERLARLQSALDSLVRAVPDSDRVGLAVYSDHFNPAVPVLGMRENRKRLRSAISRVQAGGHATAYDSTLQAYGIQRELASSKRQNSVLVLAHSDDNASKSKAARVRRMLGSQRDGPRVRVLTVAYDTPRSARLRPALRAFAKVSRGEAFQATPHDVGAKLRAAWKSL
jgi:hypothetical protein